MYDTCEHEITTFLVAKKSDEKCINASKANQVTWDFGLRQVSNLYRQNKIKVIILVFQNPREFKNSV